MKKTAVIGIGFGDEAKGRTVSALCARSDRPLVIRFSGGHQAGHHVMLPGPLEHVFSNFGSGTLQGHPTYWSSHCTVDPVGILTELDEMPQALSKTKVGEFVKPVLYIDGRCPIVTPLDKAANIIHERTHRHGTCGVGFGQTLQREEDRYSLTFSDLFIESILFAKLDMILKYYSLRMKDAEVELFLKACAEITKGHEDPKDPRSYEVHLVDGVQEASDMSDSVDWIFEGSQGLLLDKNIGFYPHVTRSQTGLTNALESCAQSSDGPSFPDVLLVTRAYQTRHGAGPLPHEHPGSEKITNPHERNDEDGVQGYFRTGPLDLDLLKYGLDKEHYIQDFSGALGSPNKTLVITCLDLVEDRWEYIKNNLEIIAGSEEEFVDVVCKHLDIHRTILCRTPYSL